MSDLDGRRFIRRGRTLVAADIHADAFLDTIKDGGDVLLHKQKARNPKHHAWFFALLKKSVDNLEQFSDIEELLDALKIATGHYSWRRTVLGARYEHPKSISFGSMDEDAFREWKDKALYVLGGLLGVDPVELMKEVDQEQRSRF